MTWKSHCLLQLQWIKEKHIFFDKEIISAIITWLVTWQKEVILLDNLNRNLTLLKIPQTSNFLVKFPKSFFGLCKRRYLGIFGELTPIDSDSWCYFCSVLKRIVSTCKLVWSQSKTLEQMWFLFAAQNVVHLSNWIQDCKHFQIKAFSKRYQVRYDWYSEAQWVCQTQG